MESVDGDKIKDVKVYAVFLAPGAVNAVPSPAAEDLPSLRLAQVLQFFRRQPVQVKAVKVLPPGNLFPEFVGIPDNLPLSVDQDGGKGEFLHKPPLAGGHLPDGFFQEASQPALHVDNLPHRKAAGRRCRRKGDITDHRIQKPCDSRQNQADCRQQRQTGLQAADLFILHRTRTLSPHFAGIFRRPAGRVCLPILLL